MRFLLPFLLASALSATPLHLRWDAQPGCQYRVFCGAVRLADTDRTEAIVEVPDADFQTLTVQAYNFAGSAMSDPITVARVRIQWSDDLHVWHSQAVWIPTAPGFVRIAYPISPTKQ